jgi:nucleoid DNA-binding protein
VNNKEFISTLAKSLDIKEDNAESGVTMLVRALTDLLSEKENTVLKLKNFGSFEIKKRKSFPKSS